MALQLSLITLESWFVTGFVSRLFHRVVGRPRPWSQDCVSDPDAVERCGSGSENLSFFSGHTALATTGAALVCSFHRNLPLYGGGVADRIACGALVGLAGATAILRLNADRHWMTDVFAGAAIGTASGYLLPNLLHFRGEGGVDMSVVPLLRPDMDGMALRLVL